MSSGHDFDDDHCRTTGWANEGRFSGAHRRIAVRGFSVVRNDMQQRTHLGEILRAPAIGDQPVVPNAVKSAGQNVEQEAAHELVSSECHRLVARAALGPVILPAKCDAAFVHGDKSLIGDCHAVRVARQIRQHRRRPGKWALGIDHPFAGAQRYQPVGKGGRIAQRRELSEELQLTRALRLLDLFEETPAKESREHANR